MNHWLYKVKEKVPPHHVVMTVYPFYQTTEWSLLQVPAFQKMNFIRESNIWKLTIMRYKASPSVGPIRQLEHDNIYKDLSFLSRTQARIQRTAAN